MAALAKVEESLPRKLGLFNRDRLDVTPARRRKVSAWRAPSGPSCPSITIESSMRLATLIHR